jgi:hypothetical protein
MRPARWPALWPGATVRRASLADALVPLAGLLALFVGLRWWLALTPTLSETYYDEALTGLMAFDILRGGLPVFYWGEPYGGAVGDAYIAAAGFQLLGPSTLVLRMSAVAVAALWAWAAYSMARRIAGGEAGALAGLLIAVPPVFLSYVQLSSQGEGVAMALGAVALAAAARLGDPAVTRREWMPAAVGLGLTAGLGWWASQITVACLVAAAAVVLVRPRLLRTPVPYVALGLFALASLPFWLWNWRHDWATFRHLAGWGGPPPPFAERVAPVVHTFLATLAGSFWDGRAVTLPAPAHWLDALLVTTVYAPAVGLAVARALTWVARVARRERPWQDPLDVVVLGFWSAVAAHLATWFGSSGILRYAIAFYATVPVLVAVVLARLSRLGPTPRAVARALAVALLAYNGLTHVLFVREAAGEPFRPIDRVIARLERLGIRGCYADSRVAQVITFESRERVACADFYGYRDFTRLQAVDAIEDPAAVAVVTHWGLQSPSPEELAATLRLMGVAAAEEQVGHHVIFHGFQAPDGRLAPIPPAGWSARASVHGEDAAAVFDRRVWTRWSAPKQGGEWLEIDLGRVHRLAQLTLEAGPFPRDAPASLRVETSLDGRRWDVAARADGLLAGLHWWKGRLHADETGRVIVRLVPRPVRHVRLVQAGPGPALELWSVSELFAYEAAPTPWAPPAAAVEAHAAATGHLARWMDDPTGPHPRRAPVTYEQRRAQVPWAAVFAETERAVAAAPEWEDAHHLHALALSRSGWSEAYDVVLERARADGDWPAVVRWADLADLRYSAFWRSGRGEARAEALGRLGQVEAAAAARRAAAAAEATRQPAQPGRARFGDVLELRGVDVPLRARAGETVSLRCGWRALRPMPDDYTAFVHIQGPGGVLHEDYRVGGDFGTSRWAAGERTWETVAVELPATLPPGAYRVKLGVWRPERRSRLPVAESDFPREHRAVIAATLTVER